MSYFLFQKNSENIEGSLIKIAENQFDLDNLNLSKSDVEIINDSLNFESVKLNLKNVSKYVNNTIIFNITNNSFDKTQLENYVNDQKKLIKHFIDNNSKHSLFNRWNNYYNQLNNLNFDSINYPLNISLEQYFKNLGQPYLNILQLP